MTKLFTLFGIDTADGDTDTAPLSVIPQPDAAAAAISVHTAATPAPLVDVLYLTEPGSSTAISVSDINQGGIGDCFLLASIGEVALLKPSFISNMIQANSNGTETVTLYEASNGRVPQYNTTAFKAVTETVTNVFLGDGVNSGATQDVVNGQKEIWPQVLEKAVAMLDGGYGAIADGGSPLVAMEELTGHATSHMSPGALTAAQLTSLSASSDLIVFDTLANGALGNGLYNDHAYMFEGMTGSGASATVKLGNPWGFDQPTPILLSQLSKNFSEVDIGHFA